MGSRSGLLRMLAAACTAVAAIGATTAGTVSTSQAAGRGAATGPFGINKTELLINGDRLAVSGKVVTVAMAGHGFAAAVTELRLAGQLYAIPDAAFGFLGRGLDLSLFNTAALPGNGRLPVRIAYTGRVPRLPGVTITGAAGGVAAGYLTAASAPAFGAALARQFAADHGRGSYGTDGLFGGGVTVSLAGALAAPRAPAPGRAPRVPRVPRFKMHVLTVHGVTAAGKPDTGDTVFVTNTDNEAFFGDPYEASNLFYHGTAKYSVPDGHYWAIGIFFTPGKQTGDLRVVVDPGFTVRGNTAVSIRARSASQQVVFSTPKPATASFITLTLADRMGQLGADLFTFISDGTVRLWLSPTHRRLRSGTLREFVTANLTLRSQGAKRPEINPAAYYLAFQGPNGVIGSQHFVADHVATVHASYSSDVATTGALLLTGVPSGLLADGIIFGVILPVKVPARQTEYLTAEPDVFWFGQYFQSYATLAGGQADTTRVFKPGSDISLRWNTYPLHTVLNTSVLGGKDPMGAFLSATRDGNALTVYVTPFSDGTTGHTGSGFRQGLFGSGAHISGGYRLYVNGALAHSGSAVGGSPGIFASATLPAKPSKVGYTLTAKRTGALYPLSTATSTTWVWQSAAGAGINLPQGWSCADGANACMVEPLMTLGYDVAGIGVDGTAPAGAQVVKVTAGHQQFAGSPAITSVRASVSFNNGATWQPAEVTGSGGTRFVVFDAPAASYVSLKVWARDAAGGSVTESIKRAYATATPADASPADASPADASRADASRAGTSPAVAAQGYRAACPVAGLGDARCFVLYSPVNAAARARAAGFPAVSAPAGWGARAIEQAYRLPIGRNPHQTVAVVEAFNTPNLGSYLNTYRRHYGLAPCTTASGCLRIVNQAGRVSPLPANSTNSGWDLEATLDVDMVSAACPRCHILVVEANSQAVTALAAAASTAARLGAAAVSNSYGTRENGLALKSARAYDHPGHAIVASSGDFGYTAASFPADLATVTAVGGTQLATAPNARGWLETVWNVLGAGAGSSGCSAYVAKPRWQHDTHCPGRTVADVAALGWDVAVYEKHYGGWVEVGGTSASSPIVAGIFGLAGNAAAIRPGYEYAHARALFDVTKGNNDWWFFGGGKSCGNDYLCVAKKGYDAPTGVGTPDGVGAF